MIRTGLLLAGVCLLAVTPARADMVADWMAGKVQTSAPAVTSTGPEQDLKFGHPAPPVSLVPPIWRGAMEVLATKTNGQLRFKEYGAGTLIGPRDGFKAVRGGVAEWATCYTQFEGRGFELSRVFEQPFIAPTNPMAAVRIAHELAEKYFVPEFERQGVAFGTFGAFVPTDIMSKRPIRRWEDLKGLKIVAQGFPPEAAAAMEATFVNIPYPEIYVAMQQGLADALVWVDAGFIPYKIAEVAKYHTRVGLTGSGIHHCYNKEWFAGLAPDVQAAFVSVQEPLGMSISKITGIDFGKNARETYIQNGVEMIELEPAELARWREKLSPVLEDWITKNEAAGMPARQLLADIAALAEKYNAMTPDELMKLSLEDPVLGRK